MAVKVLHTADWHIGKMLHGYSLEDDHRAFLVWLSQKILERDIDLLLIAGDIFDTAFPSHNSLTIYYQFLKDLANHKVKIVVTGGNHDSPGILSAPSDILRLLDIHVVGSISEDPEGSHFVFENLGLAVAAVPFLRESDLRKSVSGQSYDDRLKLIKEGIKGYYQRQADWHNANYPHLGLLGMGHLHVSGADTSPDSEKEIHKVGSLEAFGRDDFPGGYEYMALGHIHKPQKMTDRMRYSGSPIPLSFSERNDPKQVIELQFDDGRLARIENMEVPVNRVLRKIVGTLGEVKEKVNEFRATTRFVPLIEVEVIEQTFDPSKIVSFDALKREWEKAEDFRVIKPRIIFLNRVQDTAELFTSEKEISDLSPKEVFDKLLEEKKLDDTTSETLRSAFEELLNELHESAE